MTKKFGFSEKLDFTDIDLTAPEKVIEEVLAGLPEETNGIILGKIQPYSGHVFSYTKKGMSSIRQSLIGVNQRIDIQEDLGEIGQETHKFECFLYTPEYDKYRYRVFFVQYDVANYPVSVILDESVAESISDSNFGYIYICNDREELETLMFRIFTSNRIIAVMQELIRINQAKKAAKDEAKTDRIIEVDHIAETESSC